MIGLPTFSNKQFLFIFPVQGDKINISNSNIIIRDVENRIKFQGSCYKIFVLYIIGDILFTTPLIRASSKYNFNIVFMTLNFKVYSIISNGLNGNILLKKKQYNYFKIDIGKFLIINKIENQIKVLKSIRNKNNELKNDIKYISRKLNLIKSFYLKENKMELLKVNTLMGYEGNISKIYFKHMFYELEFTKRIPRVKCDYINSILDIGYTFLFNFIDSIVSIYGFDTYCGFLHRQFYMRKSLICDFIEPFRPLIDKQIKKSINLKQFSKKDFKKINEKYQLKYECNKKYMNVFYECIYSEKDEIFKFIQGFYRAFMKDFEIEKYVKYNVK